MMGPNEYQKLAERTEADPARAKLRLTRALDTPDGADCNTSVRLVHALLGMQTEAGELANAVKRWVFYGKPLDPVNVKEELGDLLWYVALACNAMGLIMEDVMAANIAKLRVRFPEKFTEENALSRDSHAEMKTLTDICGE